MVVESERQESSGSKRSTGRPTLSQVASLAGVSKQTASRVVRGSERVSASTARRVRKAIAVLDYQPDLLARALSTGSSSIIGVVTHALGMFGTVSILSGIETAAEQRGYGVSIANLTAFDPGTVQESIDRLTRTGCDGVIVMAPWATDGPALRAARTRIPLVTTSQVPEFDGAAVYPDSVRSAGELVTHLLDLGHRSVWHIQGPDGWNVSDLRASGWRAALEAAGAETPEPVRGDWSARSGYDAGLRIADAAGATAVFAANDEMALGAIHALAERGLRVPEDVSVVGYDDAPSSEFLLPSLTTVRVDKYEHGRLAVDQLLRQLDGLPPEQHSFVHHELVVRKSSGRAPH